MTHGTYGPQWHREFARYDPDSSVWRTSQATFLWDSDRYSETWPKSGTTRGGCAYALPTWAPPIAAPGCSSPHLLPTPLTADAQGNCRANPGGNPTLTGAVEGYRPRDVTRTGRDVQPLLPTPTAMDSRASGGSRPSNVTLTDAVVQTEMGAAPNPRQVLLPTPMASDGEKGGPNQRGGAGDLRLSSAVHLLPTPAVNDMGRAYTPDEWNQWTGRMRAKHGNGNGHGPSLEIEAQRMALLPTPTTSEATGAGYTDRENGGGRNLRTEVSLLLLPTPSVADGMGGHATRSGARSTELLLPGVAQALSCGERTGPPSPDGSGSPDGPLLGQLSLLAEDESG